MSKFRDKAAEIKAAGEAQRGNFEPSGAPKRMYDYWLSRSDTKRAEDIRHGLRAENFCHFWRVVAIWGPLMFLKEKALDVAVHPISVAIFAILVVGFFFGLPLFVEGWEAVLILLGTLVAAVALVVLGAGLAYLIDKFPRQAQFIGKWLAITASVALVAILVIGFVVWAGWVAVTLLTIGAVVGVVAYLNVERISDYIHYRRAKREAAADERRRLRELAFDAYLRGEGPNPYAIVKRKPSVLERKIGAFFKGIGDFIVMAAQVVRVNKWKICPIVEIDSK